MGCFYPVQIINKLIIILTRMELAFITIVWVERFKIIS